MRCLKFLFLIVTLAAWSPLAEASQNTAELRMAVVDFQRALNSVEEGVKAMREIEQEGNRRRAALEKQQEELEELQKKLEEFQRTASTGMMSPEAMAEGQKMQRDFREKFEAYNTALQEADQTIQRRELEARRRIINRLRELVTEMGRKETYNVILEANESGLLYAASYTDITERIIQEYNKRHKAD